MSFHECPCCEGRAQVSTDTLLRWQKMEGRRYSAEDYERVIAAGGNMWSTLERLREMAMETHRHRPEGASRDASSLPEQRYTCRIEGCTGEHVNKYALCRPKAGASRETSSPRAVDPNGPPHELRPLLENAVKALDMGVAISPGSYVHDELKLLLSQGASRELSASESASFHNTLARSPRVVGPASLVGALQDVVHTDPGPVRAGKAHRDASSPGSNDWADAKGGLPDNKL
jgi:hypothetical protein